MEAVSLMIGNINFNYSVGVMLVKDENILIEVSSNDEHVVVPGGRVKANESLKASLKRDELNNNFLVNYDSKNNYYKWINIEELKDINLLPTAIKKCVNSNKINHFINK